MFRKIFVIFVAVLLLAPIQTALPETEVKLSEEGEPKIKKDSLDEDFYTQAELFTYALVTIHSEYADEPTAKDLIYGALKGMLSSLDQSSTVMELLSEHHPSNRSSNTHQD